MFAALVQRFFFSREQLRCTVVTVHDICPNESISE